ncbi:MAG: pyruvate kinase, partial [Acidobacteriota bacterium]|nr:pyruvate kinase [Acidobacteriota bacterium]
MIITRPRDPYRRTKIVCTLGPASETLEQIRALFAAGMDVARLNFSHQTIDWHRERVAMIRDISAEAGQPIGILQDLPGPKIRVGNFPDGPVELKVGQEFTLTAGGTDGDIGGVSVNQKALIEAVEPGDPILLSDGTIRLRASHIKQNSVVCEVTVGGKLGSHKGVNLPNRTVTLPSMTEYDHEALIAGLDMGVDFVALSFVRSRDDVEIARKVIEDHGRHVPIIAKIEKFEAL